MKIQLTHTYHDIISLENLLLAWQEFIVGKKSKHDVQLFARDLMDNILSLHSELVNKTYAHGGYESFHITDPKRRHIHKASVRDRLLHHAVYRILYPFFDRTFIADSYSCRRDKGVHKALNRFRAIGYQVSNNHTRTCWVLKCDIKKFFASIDHALLLNILREYIPDADIVNLLENIVGSFQTLPLAGGAGGGLPKEQVLVQRKTPPTSPGRGGADIGLPLGNLTSQLFANVYMNVFDQWVKHYLKAQHYIRYADDFVLLSHDKKLLEQRILQIEEFLTEQLHLSVHPDKIIFKTLASGIDFLGWTHFTDHRIVRRATRRRMLARVKNAPTPESVQSYLGLLQHGNAEKARRELLHWYWLLSS